MSPASRQSYSLLFCAFSAALLSAGCSSASSESNEESDDALEANGSARVSIHLRIAESKELFTSKVESFSATDSGARELPCRDRSFNLVSKKSLYAAGWSPDQAASFSEDVEGAELHEYPFASCRDDKTELLGWFGKAREFEFVPTDQLLAADYEPTKLPLLLQRKTIGDAAAKYYSCDANFEKKLIRETANAKHYDISLACKETSAPSKAVRGPIDFISNPGIYGAVASYRGWMLPAVPSNGASLAKVKTALLGLVGKGTYAGAMRTLSSTCTLHIKDAGEKLVVDHTIDSSGRTRHLELATADLLGFDEGDLFADPNRAGGAPTGKFAAAEFRDAKGGSLTIRFEQNTGADAKIVRIDGSEAYCRRLEKK